MIVLDTHAAVWWIAQPDRLGRLAAAAIGAADLVGIPTIVFWEVALLVRRRRLSLARPVGEWAHRLLAIPRVRALDLGVEIAVLADSLAMHDDPADRFIVATALHHRAPLASKDGLLRSLPFVETVWS